MNKEALLGVGLTEKESEVYLALIELGSSSAGQIIQKTGLHRAVVYDLLERLIEKGLVGHVIKGRKKYFESTNPKKLLDIVKEKEMKIRGILPSLLELSQFKESLDVKIYKGKEGIKTVFEDILREKPGEWLSLGSGGETFHLLPAFLTEFHKNRVKEKIKGRGLLINNSSAIKRGEILSKMSLTEIRYLPKTIVTPTVINIYNTRVALYAVTKDKIPFIILIENEQLAHSFKEYFESLWKISKK
ncbi:hypothetical protein J4208_05880 [Candidatus Woesearchaeota archaeon]|nr:hypothetical protein [Candidatus Woesearchaeota archaeon]